MTMFSQPPRLNTVAFYAALESGDSRSLRRVAAILDGKPPFTEEFLQGLLRGDLLRFRRSRRQQMTLSGLTILFFILAQGRLLLGWHIAPEWSLLCLIPGLVLMQSLALRCTAQHRIRKRILNILFLMQTAPSVQHIGILVDVLRYGDGEASLLAQELLVQALPQWTEADLLTQNQHCALSQTLRGTNTQLIMAVLAAFGRVGTARSLRAVRRLAASRPVWLAEARQIECAAKECLRAMLQREREQHTTQTLLRATTLTPCTTEISLRQYTYSGGFNKEQGPARYDSQNQPLTCAVLRQKAPRSEEQNLETRE